MDEETKRRQQGFDVNEIVRKKAMPSERGVIKGFENLGSDGVYTMARVHWSTRPGHPTEPVMLAAIEHGTLDLGDKVTITGLAPAMEAHVIGRERTPEGDRIRVSIVVEPSQLPPVSAKLSP